MDEVKSEQLILSDEEQEQLNKIVAEDNAEFEAQQAAIEAGEVEEPSKMTKHQLLHAVTQAARDGLIGVGEKMRLRQELGIFQSDFTRKKVTKKKRKQRRSQQKKARRKNR